MNGDWTYAHCNDEEFAYETYEDKEEAIEAGKERFGDVFQVGQISVNDKGIFVINVEIVVTD